MHSSLRWYHDMIYGTKNPWGAQNSFIIAIFATLGSVLLGTVAALGLSRHMPYSFDYGNLNFSNDCSSYYFWCCYLFLYSVNSRNSP